MQNTTNVKFCGKRYLNEILVKGKKFLLREIPDLGFKHFSGLFRNVLSVLLKIIVVVVHLIFFNAVISYL